MNACLRFLTNGTHLRPRLPADRFFAMIFKAKTEGFFDASGERYVKREQ
ncbi:hypothetical protein HNR34_002497 [Geobacillus subterraneus]